MSETTGRHRLYEDQDARKARLLGQLPAAAPRPRLSARVVDHAPALRLQAEARQARWHGDARWRWWNASVRGG